MPQRKKAKTKSEMKKSIKNLYDALQAEKAKHAKASDMVSIMKLTMARLSHRLQCSNNRNECLKEKLDEARYDEQHASEVMANLVRKLG